MSDPCWEAPVGRCFAVAFGPGPIARAHLIEVRPGSEAHGRGLRWTAALYGPPGDAAGLDRRGDGVLVGYLDAPAGHRTPRELRRELRRLGVAEVRMPCCSTLKRADARTPLAWIATCTTCKARVVDRTPPDVHRAFP